MPKKVTATPQTIPEIGVDGARRNRRKPAMSDPVARKAAPRAELPNCPKCIARRAQEEAAQRAKGVRKPKNLPSINKVRTDAFGQPCGECSDCLARMGGRGSEGLKNMPSLADRDPERAKGRSHLKVVE